MLVSCLHLTKVFISSVSLAFDEMFGFVVFVCFLVVTKQDPRLEILPSRQPLYFKPVWLFSQTNTGFNFNCLLLPGSSF